MARKTADDGRTDAPLTGDAIAALSLEAGLKQLEAVLAQLEQQDLPLERAIVLAESGQHLVAHCNAKIAQAELRLSQLTPGAA
jgi:exodeoxyribonuclease VII small subunit